MFCVYLFFQMVHLFFIEKDQHKSKPQYRLEAIEKNRHTLKMTGPVACAMIKWEVQWANMRFQIQLLQLNLISSNHGNFFPQRANDRPACLRYFCCEQTRGCCGSVDLSHTWGLLSLCSLTALWGASKSLTRPRWALGRWIGGSGSCSFLCWLAAVD